jgi:hypothetical protein
LLPEAGYEFIQYRQCKSIPNALSTDFIKRLEDIHIHGILTGNIASPAHLTGICYLQQLRGVLQPTPQQGKTIAHPAATGVGMEIVSADTGANIHIGISGDLFQWNEFTG